ncbi:MAG: hypothetical protein AMS26_23620 [Bacteroides sp. SM23_62]|nr:MAG: hypothetical protein AMS26_23620 [Bacteroides sp. SM23_62]
MHIKLENLPIIMEAPGTKMHMQDGLGGMAVSYNEMPVLASTPNLLEGLPNDSCPCPHWGYMLKGSMHIRYDNGDEELINAGEVFYFPAGHIGWTEGEVAWLEFSPEKEVKEVMDHVGRKMQEMNR